MPTENRYSSNGAYSANGHPLFNKEEEETDGLLEGSAVQEIVSNKPGFLIRWGITIFFLVLVAIICACWFIQYPDIVNTRAKLTSINAPKEVKINVSGKLVRLLTKENDFVNKGYVLGYMESIANPEEIIQLTQSLDSLKSGVEENKDGQITGYSNVQYQNLGEQQQAYQTFMQSLTHFKDFLSNGFYLRKKAMLFKDMTNLKRLNSNLLAQKDIQQKDLGLAEQTFEANKKLKDEKVISAFDYRNEQSKLLSKQLSLPQMTASIINNESQQNEKQKEIMDLENQIAQQKNIFIQSLNTLQSQLDEWRKKYLLVAPIDGHIAFASFLQENQQLQANQTICFINPGNTEYYVEMLIPQAGLGKIKQSQQVLLKFPSYPYQEYGSVNGKIDFISNITTDSGYLAKVILPQGLTTNYKKRVQFREGLYAQAEIITENMRLLQRFYNNIRSLIR